MHPSLRESRPRLASWGRALFLCLLGAYLNAAAYGFYHYPKGADYDFLLPLANWLRDSSLYPGDPIREFFVGYNTSFWPIVSKLSQWFSTEHVLIAFFLLTKLVYFLAIGRLVAAEVRHKILGACIVATLALSGTLNFASPLGGATVLGRNSEHGQLAFAMLLLAGTFLVEGRWWSASIIGGLSVYIDALLFLQTLPAFAILALVDWREQKRRIGMAALLGAGISLPWLVQSCHALAANFPKRLRASLPVVLSFPLHAPMDPDLQPA